MAKKLKRELTQSEKDYLHLINANFPFPNDISVALSVLSEILLSHERQFIHALAHAIGEEMSARFFIHPAYLDDLKGGTFVK